MGLLSDVIRTLVHYFFASIPVPSLSVCRADELYCCTVVKSVCSCSSVDSHRRMLGGLQFPALCSVCCENQSVSSVYSASKSYFPSGVYCRAPAFASMQKCLVAARNYKHANFSPNFQRLISNEHYSIPPAGNFTVDLSVIFVQGRTVQRRIGPKENGRRPASCVAVQRTYEIVTSEQAELLN